MTVRRGQDWGGRGPLPVDGVLAAGDAEAGAVVTDARRSGRPIPALGLIGGDLCRTLGGRGDPSRLRGPDATRVTVDLGAVLADGRLHWFVAHLVARRSWWRGSMALAMNAQWLGSWNVAPRAHPGDGLLEILEASLSLPDRLKARRRLTSGTHVPHPAIIERRTSATQLDMGRAVPVRLDGVSIGPARHLSVRLEPDALHVVV